MVSCYDCNFIDREHGPARSIERKFWAIGGYRIISYRRYRIVLGLDEVTLKVLSFNARFGEDFRIFFASYF